MTRFMSKLAMRASALALLAVLSIVLPCVAFAAANANTPTAEASVAPTFSSLVPPIIAVAAVVLAIGTTLTVLKRRRAEAQETLATRERG